MTADPPAHVRAAHIVMLTGGRSFMVETTSVTVWTAHRGGGPPKMTTSTLFYYHILSVFRQTVDHDETPGRVWYFLRQVRSRSAMAKGEGGEQYSNATLLNKPGSSDDIKLPRKVSSFIRFWKTFEWVERAGELTFAGCASHVRYVFDTKVDWNVSHRRFQSIIEYERLLGLPLSARHLSQRSLSVV